MHKYKYWIVLLVGLTAVCPRAQDHGHLNVGSSGTALTFENGADFDPSTRYVKTLMFASTGKYANFYEGNITLTALHSTNAFGERDPLAPEPGAFIVAEIVSVQGPSGGSFGFWDEDSTTAPTYMIATGTTNGAYRFILSNAELGAGLPGGDPFGHIHGRRFTATLPGIYTVGFKAYDTSTNGPSGGPIHTPSSVQKVQFQAGIVLTAPAPNPIGMDVTFGAPSGYVWQLQSTEDLALRQWTNVGDPVMGRDLFETVPDFAPPAERGFYRAVGTVFVP